jgi:carbon monoxide dehydrogenase subunit G
MEIATDFELPLAADDAYRMLLDLEQVAPCMPGAALGSERDDGSRELTVTVRLGPMKFVYGGTVRISERHDQERRAVLVGAADEQRGQGSASATITMTVSENGDSASRVDSLAVLDLTGRAAQTGRGIVEDVSRRMVRDMATCLAAKAAPVEPEPAEGGAPPAPGRQAAPAPQAKPISGGKLFLSLLWERIARLWRRRER